MSRISLTKCRLALSSMPLSKAFSAGRVEDWRGGPQDIPCLYPGFPPSCPFRNFRDSVSSPRLLKRSMRISRTTLSCALRIKLYGAYQIGVAFNHGPLPKAYSTSADRKPDARAPG